AGGAGVLADAAWAEPSERGGRGAVSAPLRPSPQTAETRMRRRCAASGFATTAPLPPRRCTVFGTIAVRRSSCRGLAAVPTELTSHDHGAETGGALPPADCRESANRRSTV